MKEMDFAPMFHKDINKTEIQINDAINLFVSLK
jgi:hypothetical protein